jgi:hypothetical protein
MRRLQPPTLGQWGCAHRWKTTTSRRGGQGVLRVRYLTCLKCGLRVKTEERLAVPWDEQELVALVQRLLPEGQAIYLRDRGITELPLYGLNAILARQGYVIHATKVRNPKRFVACTDKDGRVENYGLFELKPMHQEPPGRTNRKGRQGRSSFPGDRRTEGQRERRIR